jgi:hypothetical protein
LPSIGFAEHRNEAEVARFIEALDDMLHDIDRGTPLQREVGWTMGSVGR